MTFDGGIFEGGGGGMEERGGVGLMRVIRLVSSRASQLLDCHNCIRKARLEPASG